MAAWPRYSFSVILPIRNFPLELVLCWISLKAETASEADINQSGNLYFRPHYGLFLHLRPQIAFLAQPVLSLNGSGYRPRIAFFGGH
jgi:hypothetical protein